MLTIADEAEKDRYLGRSIISIYLDHVYSTERISAIFQAKRGFDAHVGPVWHLLIPYMREGEGDFAVDSGFDANCYNAKLARQIINKHQLSHDVLPVISFEAAEEGGEPFFFSLAELTPDQIRRTIGEIADIAVEASNDRYDDENFRTQTLEKIRVYLNREKAKSFIAAAYHRIIEFATVAGMAAPFFTKGPQ